MRALPSMLLTVALLALCGCAEPNPPAQPAGPNPPPAGPAASGLNVQTVKLVGDFTLSPEDGQRRPSTAPVHVFRGRVQPFQTPDPRHPALVTIARPDAAGRLALPLPPGQYTLVLEIGGKLYLNSWLEDGSWATATVEAGRWTDYVIEDVLEATF